MDTAMTQRPQRSAVSGGATIDARQAGIEIDTKFAILDVLAQRICAAIIEEAKRWPADLNVIGTHGRHGFNHLILGSVAEGVIRLATKPVLVIRGG